MGLTTFITIIIFLSAYILVIFSHALKIMREDRAAGVVRLLVVAILTVVLCSVSFVFILDNREKFKELLYHLCSEKTIDCVKTAYQQCFGENPLIFAIQVVGGFLEFLFYSAIVAILSCSLVAVARKLFVDFTTQTSVVDIQEKKIERSRSIFESAKLFLVCRRVRI